MTTRRSFMKIFGLASVSAPISAMALAAPETVEEVPGDICSRQFYVPDIAYPHGGHTHSFSVAGRPVQAEVTHTHPFLPAERRLEHLSGPKAAEKLRNERE